MSVKYSNLLRRWPICFVHGVVLPMVLLAGCSSISGVWYDVTHERDEQMVGGPKRAPNYNQPPYQTGMAPDVLYRINGSPHDPLILEQDNDAIEYSPKAQEYVPVATPSSQSDPVILKYDQAPPENAPEEYRHTPMPNEPSVFDRISGWFSSSLAPERLVVSYMPVSDVESAVESLPPPPLTSVPATPERLQQARMEGPAQADVLQRMHQASMDLREALDKQRAEEAPESLLLMQTSGAVAPAEQPPL